MATERSAIIPTFYGVGVGPGDPELLTLKAARVLGAVERIFYPGSARSEGSRAAHIIAPLGLPEKRLHAVTLCMDRQRSSDLDAYDQVAAEIVTILEQGQSAAWITEGDPLFYSTFLHVRRAVLRQAPAAHIEIIPGVTSVQAAAARAGVPIAQLDETIAVVPAAYGLSHLSDLLQRCTTVVLLKVHTAMDELLMRLAAVEVPLEAVYLEQVGTPAERLVTDLASLRGRQLPYFSLVILRRAAEVRS